MAYVPGANNDSTGLYSLKKACEVLIDIESQGKYPLVNTCYSICFPDDMCHSVHFLDEECISQKMES